MVNQYMTAMSQHGNGDDGDAPVITIGEAVRQLMAERVPALERFKERAEPTLFDREMGLCTRVDVVERRQDRISGMMDLVRWTLAFAGAGTLLMVVSILGQALGWWPK